MAKTKTIALGALTKRTGNTTPYAVLRRDLAKIGLVPFLRPHNGGMRLDVISVKKLRRKANQ